MRYLLAKNQEYELSARMKYLYDIFHLFFTIEKSPEDPFITLRPVGSDDISILFLVGHNYTVCQYLSSCGKYISEEMVVLITCYSSELFLRVLPKRKQVFATNPAGSRLTHLLNGSEFNMGFFISKPELMFYNSNITDFYRRTSESFYRIK